MWAEGGGCSPRIVYCVAVSASLLPTTCILFLLSGWKADLAFPPAFHPPVGSPQNQKGEQPGGYHCPQPTFWSESALCWRRKCAFWKSWRLHSLFSKHCISHQWVSSKLWEHLTQSGSVTLSWGVGSLQWCGEQITGNLEVILLFPALKGESGQYWVFLQRRFLGSFSLFVQSVSSVWAWLVSTSCSRHAVGPHSAVLPDQEGVCVL